MNPLSIKARNYRTFVELDLDLPTGCVAIVGENGAGKSSIVNVIDIALFGPESRTLADMLTDDVVEENLSLELTFEHADQVYRVRRTFSARGRGQTKLDFERAMDNELLPGEKWYPLTRETAATTQTAIEETIGLSRETFRASSFLAQGDGAAFTEAQPRDRKRILCDVLGLDVWDRLLDCARRDKRAAEDELVRVDNSLAFADQELAGRFDVERDRGEARVNRDAAVSQIETTEAELAKANESLAKARAMESMRLGAERALETARRAHGEALTRESSLRHEVEALSERLSGRGALDQLASQLPVLEGERERLQQRTQQADEHDRLMVERNRMLTIVDDSKNKAFKLHGQADEIASSEAPGCPMCGQAVDRETRQKLIGSITADAESAELIASEADQEADALAVKVEALASVTRPSRDETAILHDRIQRAQHAREQVAALDEAGSRETELRGHLEECRESIPAHEQAVKTAQDELRALLPVDGELPLPELEDSARDLSAALTGWRDTLNEATIVLARCDERLARLSKIHDERVSHVRRRGELQRELDILIQLERAYGKDGIPALILEASAIPAIETHASEILTRLGGAASSVELRTQRALKSGDGLKEALEIVIHTEAGERDYSTFSGGERTRIDLALRLALARLLADRRGAESRLLVIDEPDGLDEQGFAALVEILNELQSTFDRVYVVSHHPDLRHAFDQTIELVKENGRSRVIGAGEREALLALPAAGQTNGDAS